MTNAKARWLRLQTACSSPVDLGAVDWSAKLGLDNAWAINAVKAVGNYDKVFERNICSRSKLAIPRG